MSKYDNCHCAWTTKVVVKSPFYTAIEGTPKEENLEASSEKSHRGCGVWT